MENKYITVAYKLYAMIDGEKELIEEKETISTLLSLVLKHTEKLTLKE